MLDQATQEAMAATAAAEWHEDEPAKTVEGGLEYLVRVINRFREPWPDITVGLLEKTAGENIVDYNGTMVSASRLVYPDYDMIVKILSDVPTTNGITWDAEEGIPDEGHHGGYVPVDDDGSGGGTEPPDSELEERVAHLEAEVARLDAEVTDLERRMKDQEALHIEVNAQLGIINSQIAQLWAHTHHVGVDRRDLQGTTGGPNFPA